MDLTPIVFELTDSVEHESVAKTKFNEFRLLVTSPSTARGDRVQAISWPKVIKVPKSGIVKLKLLPTRKPADEIVGRDQLYKVELFHQHHSEALDTWYWDVPEVPAKLTYTKEYPGESFTLPANYFELAEVSPDDYTLSGNKIDFPNLETGAKVTITYRPGYNLNEVTSYPYDIEKPYPNYSQRRYRWHIPDYNYRYPHHY